MRLWSKKNIQLFLLWYLCLVFVAGTVVTAMHIQTIRQERATYLQRVSEDTQRLADYFALNFNAAVNSCNSVFQAKWYKHYRNIANLYEWEFDGMRKLEIQEDLRAKVSALAFVTDILVITPPPLSTIITPNGWFSIADYHRVYGAVRLDFPSNPALPPIVEVVDDNVCTITLMDFTPRLYQGSICVLMDKWTFSNHLQRAMPEHAAYVHAQIDGNTLYVSGDRQDDFIENTTTVNSCFFTLTIGSISYDDALLGPRVTQYALVMAVILLVFGLMSALLTWASIQPMRRLMSRIGGNYHKLEDPYRFLEGYIEAFTQKNEQLRQEKESMGRSMTQFVAQMRNEILFSLLINPNVDFQSEHVCACVPWIGKGYPFFMVLIKPKGRDETRPVDPGQFEALQEKSLHACVLPIFYNALCILLWFPNVKVAQTYRAQVAERLDVLPEERYSIGFSEVLQLPQQMHESYLTLDGQLAQQDTPLELSLTVQIDMMRLFMEGQSGVCEAVLLDLQTNIDPDTLIRFFMRVALEYGVDAQRLTKLYQTAAKEHAPAKQWHVLHAFALSLCQSIHAKRNVGMCDIAEAIRDYIETHYQDPNLSMQQLVDRFELHRTFISKVFKSHVGVTFSEYLQTLRIQRALELMRDARMSLSLIAETVGYTNYTTFKRAFVRYKGEPPSRYQTK